MSFFGMTKTVLKSLLGKPETLMYPLRKRAYAPRSRGKLSIDIKQCILCGICQRKCPTGALTVDKAAKTWEIDRLRCVMCGACVDVCPKKCLMLENYYPEAQANRDKEKHSHA